MLTSTGTAYSRILAYPFGTFGHPPGHRRPRVAFEKLVGVPVFGSYE